MLCHSEGGLTVAYWVIEDGVTCPACEGKGKRREWRQTVGMRGWPGDLETCITCHGTGTIERRVSLEDALRDIQNRLAHIVWEAEA